MRKDGLAEQSVSLPKSQTEVCLICVVVARMRPQATIDVVGRTAVAEVVEKP